MRMFDPLVQRHARRWHRGDEERHQFAASSAASRKLPTHPEAAGNDIARTSARLSRLQFAAAGLAEIAQRIHLVDQLGQVDE